MKNLYILGLALAGLGGIPAQAQLKVHQFPPSWETQLKQGNSQHQMFRTPMRVPEAIDDKSKGVVVYAGERLDQSKYRSFVKFNAGNSYNFERIKHYYKGTDEVNQQYGITCGAFDGKDYYAIFAYDYTYSSMGKSFVKLNIQNGDTVSIYNYTEAEQNAWYGDGVYGDQRNALYDMAYDPSSGTMYALGYGWRETEAGLYGFSKLYVIDPTTAERSEVMDFDCIYYDFCFDYDGNMYAMRPTGTADGMTITGSEIVKLDRDFNEVYAHATKSTSGEKLIMAQFDALGIDHTTNQLYWIPAKSTGATSLYKVDPETGVYSDCGWFMVGNWFTGLYIPYLTADNRKAAGQVGDIAATPDATGASKTTLSWTNPSKAWDGTALSEFKEVRIYRKKAGVTTSELTPSSELLSAANSDLIATVPADGKKGEAMTYVDNNAPKGISTYYVVPSRVAGELGVPDSIRCFIGTDVPGAVTNAMAVKSGEGLKVTWDAPTKGLNNGYIDEDELTYTLTRMPDNTVVAEGLKATSFQDDNLGEQKNYSYVIQSFTKAGAGAKVETNSVMAGAAIVPPASVYVNTENDASRWTTGMGSTILFNWGGGYNDEYKCLVGYGSASGTVEGTLLSPPLRLQGGKTYRITTDFYDHEYQVPFDLKVTMGTKSDNITGATVLRDDIDITHNAYSRNLYEDTFTAPADGTYYYGVTVATHGDYDSFRFYGMTIDVVAQNDLAATAISGVQEAVCGIDNNCTVTVRNLGSKAQSDYAVRIVCDNEGTPVVVGETKNVPALEPGASADVKMTFKPQMEGKFNFYAQAVLAGDENASNDASEPISLNVLEVGTTPWTNIVTSGKYESKDTHGPVSYYSAYDRMESVYYPSEINAAKGGVITRVGYMYSGNDNLRDRTDESDLKIYMGYTDLTSYTSAADALNADQLTLVYDGTMTLQPGTDNLLAFTLDTPFEYDDTRNLVIVVYRHGDVPNDQMFCGLFDVFNNSWTSGVNRSLSFAQSYDYTASGVSCWPSAPVVYLAIKSAAGVSSTTVLGDVFSYDAASHTLTFADGAESVNVYTVDGKLVKSATVAGSKQLKLDVAKGVYTVSVKTAEGAEKTTKLVVGK